VVGLDTEFLREKTYRARLCLVQVSTRKRIYLLDPLENVDLGPVAALLSDPEIEVVVHAGRQDFEIFFERYDALPCNVFDVQVAAGFAGYGASLPYGRLVQSITKTVLEKGESYSDWCKRPLTESQLTYAADDVRYLIVIMDRLKEELFAKDRLQWVEAEMQPLTSASIYESDPGAAWRRISGRGSLSGKQTSVLVEIARWREEAAMQRDIPRGWVLKDQILIELARRSPSSVQALKGIRGMAAREADKSGSAILAAIERGREAPPVESENGPSRAAQTRARTLSGLADAIVRSRCDEAGIAPELVSTRGELEGLLAAVFDGEVTAATGEAQPHRLLRGWRRELAGAAVLALAEGRIAVRSIDQAPYIEEVPL
jgi:ribonuclease D